MNKPNAFDNDLIRIFIINAYILALKPSTRHITVVPKGKIHL